MTHVQQAMLIILAGTHPVLTLIFMVVVLGVPFATVAIFLEVIMRPRATDKTKGG